VTPAQQAQGRPQDGVATHTARKANSACGFARTRKSADARINSLHSNENVCDKVQLLIYNGKRD